MKVVTSASGKSLYESGHFFYAWYKNDESEGVLLGDYVITKEGLEIDDEVGFKNIDNLVFTEITEKNIKEILK